MWSKSLLFQIHAKQFLWNSSYWGLLLLLSCASKNIFTKDLEVFWSKNVCPCYEKDSMNGASVSNLYIEQIQTTNFSPLKLGPSLGGEPEIQFSSDCLCIKTLINPACLHIWYIQTLVHTWRGWWCSIFIETNVKSQTVKPIAFQSVQHSTVHRTYSAKHNYFKIWFQKVCAFWHNSQGN